MLVQHINTANMYTSYQYLRPIAIFAGIIGILQSATWIAMTITGIVAYYCNLNFTGRHATLGTITELTFFKMYFHGNCFQENLPQVDFSALDGLTLMTPGDVHAWMWVYMMLSFFWLLSSISLLTNVRHEYIKWINVILYVWILLAFVLSVLDLTLGIIFGLDYETIMLHAHNTPLIPIIPTTYPQFVLISGQAAATIMQTVAFRGYVIWLINIILCLYFFTETFKIFDYNQLQRIVPSGHANQGYLSDQLPPIQAYENNNGANLWYSPKNSSTLPPVQSNRVKSLSGTPLYEERRRHYDYLSQPKQPKPIHRDDEDVQLRRDNVASLVRELNHRNSYNANRPHRNEPNVPDPDYSPPMPRANPFDNRPPLRSALRTSRY